MRNGMPLPESRSVPRQRGQSFRERLLDLASEHEALQHHVKQLESKLQDIEKLGSSSEVIQIDFTGERTTVLRADDIDAPDPQTTGVIERPPGAAANPGGRVNPRAATAAVEQIGPDAGELDAVNSLCSVESPTPAVVGPVLSYTVVPGPPLTPLADQLGLTPAAKNRLSLRSAVNKDHAEKEAREIWEILDTKQMGSVPFSHVADMLTYFVSTQECYIFRSEMAIQAFIEEVSERLSGVAASRLSKDHFIRIMLDDPLPTFGAELAERVYMFRDIMFSLKTSHMVRSRARVALAITPKGDSMISKCLAWLDPIVIAVIIVNAVLIGVSYDVEPNAKAWDYVEFGFTGFFVLEMTIKLIRDGFDEHFLGHDWKWNTFDAALVLLAVVDTIGTIVSDLMSEGVAADELNQLTLLRTGRLVRISRILRLLRWKLFRELRLMVTGLFYGLRTIGWAIMLLMVVSYGLALLLRQVTENESKLEEDTKKLFDDVPTAMFTVYRCFVGDCSAKDGTPLAFQLGEAYGIVFSMGYVLATMVVTLGLFNLIMAIFVESTLNIAKLEDRRRRANITDEKFAVAQKIHQLVMGIMRASQKTEAHSNHGLRYYLQILREWVSPQTMLQSNLSTGVQRDAITRDQFERAMGDPRMMAILDDLDASLEDSSRVFDALDANGDGSLQLIELVEGLMMLQGPADKLDMLETRRAVRHIQAQLVEMQKRLPVPRG